MPKPIVFSFGGTETTFGMNKVDRARLYGYKELEVLDEDGQPCELATLADDGRTLVGKGGTGIGYLTADGNWCNKDNLRPVDLEGETITPVKSSFSAPIELVDEVSFDEYFQHSVRLSYQLDLPENADKDPLINKVIDGTIFKFKYSYRGGLEADTGFLIANDQKQVFMLIGDETTIQYVGLQQASGNVGAEEAAENDDLMDFGMI